MIGGVMKVVAALAVMAICLMGVTRAEEPQSKLEPVTDQMLLDWYHAAQDTPRRIYDLNSQGCLPTLFYPEVSFIELMDSLRRKDVVLIGEEHDDAASHRLESDITYNLVESRGAWLDLGMEMFERDVQDSLSWFRSQGGGRTDGDLKQFMMQALATSWPFRLPSSSGSRERYALAAYSSSPISV